MNPALSKAPGLQSKAPKGGTAEGAPTRLRTAPHPAQDPPPPGSGPPLTQLRTPHPAQDPPSPGSGLPQLAQDPPTQLRTPPNPRTLTLEVCSL